jgi:hypothetical protein
MFPTSTILSPLLLLKMTRGDFYDQTRAIGHPHEKGNICLKTFLIKPLVVVDSTHS